MAPPSTEQDALAVDARVLFRGDGGAAAEELQRPRDQGARVPGAGLEDALCRAEHVRGALEDALGAELVVADGEVDVARASSPPPPRLPGRREA